MSEQKGTRVYVGNLTDKVKKEDLEGEFTKYGKLNSVWVAFNPPGFAFIEFEDKDEAKSACDSLNGQDILGSKLRVEISKGRRSSRGGPRGYRGPPGRSGSAGGFRSSSRGGFREGGGYRNGGSGGFRGGSRSGSRFDSYGSGRSSGGPGGYSRDSGRDSYGSSFSGGYGGGRSSGGGGGRFRSRSPVGARGRY
ncbi:RNA-binding protein Rsf1-like [Uranotaenia lowii]|uniref:RNA-binding protein Rsf1-like n=1 Tax=Uranotaenia lowii TaxID=190385 RepID=UPI00247A19A7|nr:RNA-binding protein Rsf1-like [Uranotaenia lowii]XP_055597096.1 RNA-binding protein Rsf1-like [Uranotaenia lowii]